VPVKEVVAEDQAGRAFGQEVGTEMECLGDPFGFGLLGVLERDSVVRSVPEQGPDHGQVAGGADDQDLADSGQHQRRKQLVNGRLVVDRQQLFADRHGKGIEPCAASAGEEDANHFVTAFTHASLARYHSIVDRSPCSKLFIERVNPSSFWALVSSMAYRQSCPARSCTKEICSR